MASEFEFKIDGWTPATIPQERLGEYLVQIARIYGEPGNVHFERMRRGSVVLVSKIAGPAVPKVQRRLVEIRQGHGPRDAVEAYLRVDDMLADDNSIGVLRGKGDDHSIVIAFPGREREKPIEYSGIKEEGFLEGELIRIGGKDKTIHIALRSGETVHSAIETDRDMARRLGPLIFGPPVRLHGSGTWRRSSGGTWILDRFVVASFVEVADISLADAIGGIRAIGGSEWHLETEPLATLQEMRTDGGSPIS